MGRNYINIAFFQQYNTVKKLTEGGYPAVMEKERLANLFCMLTGELKCHKSAIG